MSVESVMPSNHLILCHPLLLLPSIFPSTGVFSSESARHIRWPKYWSFGFSISPSNECSGLISYRVDWLDLLAAQGLSGGCCVAAGVGFRLGLFESVSASDRSCDRGSLLHAGSLPSELRVEVPSAPHRVPPPKGPGHWSLILSLDGREVWLTPVHLPEPKGRYHSPSLTPHESWTGEAQRPPFPDVALSVAASQSCVCMQVCMYLCVYTRVGMWACLMCVGVCTYMGACAGVMQEAWRAPEAGLCISGWGPCPRWGESQGLGAGRAVEGAHAESSESPLI